MGPDDERALIASYEALGYLKGERLVVLKPMRQEAVYRWDAATGEQRPAATDPALVDEAIAYYQTAGALLEQSAGEPAR